MSKHTYDIQGRFLGIPYDFRKPTKARIMRRMYLPGGPMFAPKVFGAGWTLNFAHRGSRWLLAALALIAAVAVAAG